VSSLTNILEYNLFPKVESLVGPGGKYEGSEPVFQGDNATPHIDAAYLARI
jgi:hypothetical protein